MADATGTEPVIQGVGRCSCGKAAGGAHDGEASMNVDPEALSATARTSTMILGCPIV